jgi:DnaJ-class molecular chaperone
MAKDFYKTLGIRRDASQSEIQDAYRELARKYHPDLNPDNKEANKRFQEVQAAFDVLSDQKKRELYDRYGSSFETIGAGGPHGGPTWNGGPGGPFGGGPSGGGFEGEPFDFSQFLGERFGSGGSGSGGFADLFSQFRHAGAEAGPRSGRQRPGQQRPGQQRRGADVTHRLQIPFTTAITGGKAQITVQRRSGKTETITVTIPPGIEDGTKIRLRGQGEPGPRGGKPGDILLAVRVSPHDHFRRLGKHLHVHLPVTLAEAALGAKVDVPTPRGTVSLQVPPGTSSGTKLRIKGHGVTAKDGKPGDLLAEVQIVLPKQLDEESRRLIEQIDRQCPLSTAPRANLQW